MINISSAVREILEMDELAKNALNTGILNYSNYARKIQSKVAKITKKSVKLRSVIVALTRIQPITSEQNSFVPKITNLSIHTSLEEITYKRDQVNLSEIQRIYTDHVKKSNEPSYFVTTQSISEITIVGDDELIQNMQKEIAVKSTYVVQNLVGVTIRFPIEYLDVPNVIYEFMRKLAVKHVNIIEVISSTTELTFIINNSDLETVVSQLSKSF